MTPVRAIRRTLIGGGSLALLLSLCVDVAMLVVPIFDMQLYDRVLESRNMDTMAMLSIACIVGLLFYAGFEYLRSICFVSIGSFVGKQLHRAAFGEGVRLAASGDKSAGPQLARDVIELRSFMASGAVATPLDALCTVVFVGVLFLLHRAFGYLAIAGISGLIVAGVVAEHLVHPAQQIAQSRRREADYALARSLSDDELVDGLGMLPAIARRWTARYAIVLHSIGQAATRAHWISGVSRTYRLGLQAAVMFVGALLVIDGKTTPGALMGANLLLNKALGPFDHLVGSCRQWQQARGAWGRVASLLTTVPSPRAPATAPAELGLVVTDSDLVLPDGLPLLTNLELRVPRGTLAVMIGPNGAGKTSLLRALAGLVELRRGGVWLDGHVVAETGSVGYLPQTVDLLEGDIGQNVAHMQRDLPGAIEAARLAGLHDAIGRMARGYETNLSGNASTLSGGMRQRVGLARALYRTPRLLLLDEPDASLDTAGSEALVRAVRHACDRGAIAIVISHRNTFRQVADLMIELHDGTATARSVPRASEPVKRLETA